MHKRILERLGERWHENFLFGVVTERGPQPSNQNARIRSDGCLGITLKTGEMTQEIIVEDAITELRALLCYQKREMG